MTHMGSSKNRGEVRIHESLDELSTDLADYIAELSEASVKERGFFAIALSGGSIISLMRNLCGAPYNKTVDWSKWYIFWADERVVAKNHVDSNYKLAKDHLLSKVIMNDPFLGKRVEESNYTVVPLKDEFLENARLFIFETYCRIHERIDTVQTLFIIYCLYFVLGSMKKSESCSMVWFNLIFGVIAGKLNLNHEDAERWILNLIRTSKLDAKINTQTGTVVMEPNHPNV